MHCFKNKRLLLVEDDIEVRQNLTYFLLARFAQVLCASSAEEGYTLYLEENPDILLTDIMLPGKDGLWLIEQIRRRSREFPALVLSGHDHQDYLKRALSLRLEAYLFKPVTSGRLFSALQSLCEAISKEHWIASDPPMYYSFERQQVKRQDTWMNLTHLEIGLMELLIREAGRVVSHALIEQTLYPDKEMSTNALRTLVRKLRAKLPGLPLSTYPGAGYRLDTKKASHAAF